jgi:nicotinamide-nucleotide amidase
MRMEDCCLAALPGVPSEMMAMFETQVLPRLQTLGLAGGVRLQRKINCFGAGESAVEKKLLDLTGRGQVPEVGITVSDATISLRILASAPTPRAAQQVIAPVERTICERLGDLVFGFDDEELQQVVLRLLGQKRLTLATAEGVTAGLLAHRLAGVPGASLWFRGGLVVYDNQLKVEFLGVPPRLLEEHGTVSGLVAEAMAIGCRTRFRTDLAVSTVGLAGPEGAGVHKPIGLVYVGLAWAGGVVSQSWNWGGTRTEIQSRTAKLALNRLRIHLMRTSSDQ